MLRDKDGMTVPRRLSSIARGSRRSEPALDQLRPVLEHRFRSLILKVCAFLRIEMNPIAEFRFRELGKDRFDSLFFPLHGLTSNVPAAEQLKANA